MGSRKSASTTGRKNKSSNQNGRSPNAIKPLKNGIQIKKKRKQDKVVERNKIQSVPISSMGTINPQSLKVKLGVEINQAAQNKIMTIDAGPANKKVSSTIWKDPEGLNLVINKIADLNNSPEETADQLIAQMRMLENVLQNGNAAAAPNHSLTTNAPKQFIFNLKDNPQLTQAKAEELVFNTLKKLNRFSDKAPLAIMDIIPSKDGKTLKVNMDTKFSMDTTNAFPSSDSDTTVNMAGHFRKKDNYKEQFKSDIIIMDQTLYKKHDPNSGATDKQKQVLAQQQNILKRQFLAMATFDIQTGDQDAPNSFHTFRRNVPLGAMIAHGGKLAFEIPPNASAPNLATQFNNLLLSGNSSNSVRPDAPEGRGPLRGTKNVRTPDKAAASNAPAGLYLKRSTHPQSFKDGKWKESSKTLGVLHQGSIGMNIPLGGVDNNGPINQIGDEGRFVNTEQNDKESQHGHAFFLFNTDPVGGGRLMVGMESAGTGQSVANQVGATHGFKSAVLSKLPGISGNTVSVTGQAKASKIPGLLPKVLNKKEVKPLKKGSLKANVTASKFKDYQQSVKDLNTIKKYSVAEERAIMRKLMVSTTPSERKAILLALNERANKLRG